MKTKHKYTVMAVLTLALIVVLFLQRLTGDAVHSVLGLVLTVAMIVHLCRQNAKLGRRPRWIQMVDWALIVVLAVLLVTGILLHPIRDVLALKIAHKLAAVLFALGVIVHIVQHRKALK